MFIIKMERPSTYQQVLLIMISHYDSERIYSSRSGSVSTTDQRRIYFITSSSTNLTIINTALKELEDGASQLEVTPVKTYNLAETQTEPLPHFLCQEIDDYDGL